ncbi:MAG: hypothetical protein MI723_07775 [Caulobacterales bacterium]|nr:hypothetical protein [Caulobacterales bacterium]
MPDAIASSLEGDDGAEPIRSETTGLAPAFAGALRVLIFITLAGGSFLRAPARPLGRDLFAPNPFAALPSSRCPEMPSGVDAGGHTQASSPKTPRAIWGENRWVVQDCAAA